MSDLRADAIKAIQNAYCKPCKERGDDYYGVRCRACEYDNAIIQIDALPLAESHNKDAISREGLLKSWEELSPRGRLEFDQVIMTIPALPSAEAVSREEYEDIIKDYRKQYENMNNEIADLEAKLSAEAEWIPCSERLPNDAEYVIVSVLDDHGDTPWKYTTVAWLCNGVWISDNDILCGTAIAWMPLPKPYREDGEE